MITLTLTLTLKSCPIPSAKLLTLNLTQNLLNLLLYILAKMHSPNHQSTPEYAKNTFGAGDLPQTV